MTKITAEPLQLPDTEVGSVSVPTLWMKKLRPRGGSKLPKVTQSDRADVLKH